MLVVGGGPAGLSAATWLARHRRRVALVDGGERRNRWVDQTHGYLGLDPVEPHHLSERATAAMLAYPTAEVVKAQATSVARLTDRAFALELAPPPVASEPGTPADGGGRADGSGGGVPRRLTARRLVLATGVGDTFPEVDGFFEHYGADAFHCPSCDGYEARDRRVVVFGWSENVSGFALSLLDWAADVTVVTDGSSFEGDASCRAALDRHGVALLEDDAVALVGSRGDLKEVRLQGGATVPCELVFFSIAHHPRNELAVSLGCALTSEGCIVVDNEGQTTVPGVYAAGDVTPGLQLVQVAAADGAVAGVGCALSLRGEPPGPGAPVPAPNLEAEIDSD